VGRAVAPHVVLQPVHRLENNNETNVIAPFFNAHNPTEYIIKPVIIPTSILKKQALITLVRHVVLGEMYKSAHGPLRSRHCYFAQKRKGGVIISYHFIFGGMSSVSETVKNVSL